MKKLVLSIALIGAFQTQASETSVTYYGIDDDRQECSVTIDPQGNYTLKASGYTFTSLELDPMVPGSGARFFEDLTMDYGDNVYSPVIGSPITIAGIGLLKVFGKVVYDGQDLPTSMDLKAKGGLLDWYSRQFVCTQLK